METGLFTYKAHIDDFGARLVLFSSDITKFNYGANNALILIPFYIRIKSLTSFDVMSRPNTILAACTGVNFNVRPSACSSRRVKLSGFFFFFLIV